MGTETILEQKREARRGHPSRVSAAELQAPAADARPFIVDPAPFPNYPLNGQPAIVIISYTVPAGMRAVVKWLSIVNIGGGFIDGSGQVVWRVLVNGAAVKGLHNLQSQVGTYAQPNEVLIALEENDTIEVTVEVPAGQPDMPAGSTAAARMHGWAYPISEEQK
jgi:hypothetical protein